MAFPSHPAHFVQFFAVDDALADAAGRFVCRGIESDATCVVLATAPHLDDVSTRLRSKGLDPIGLAAAYRYIAIDGQFALDSFMNDEGPDRQRFHENMGLLIRQAACSGRPVHVFGELMSVLALQGKLPAAIRLEELWNELSQYHTFSRFCAWPLSVFDGNSRAKALVCAMHSHVLRDEDPGAAENPEHPAIERPRPR